MHHSDLIAPFCSVFAKVIHTLECDLRALIALVSGCMFNWYVRRTWILGKERYCFELCLRDTHSWRCSQARHITTYNYLEQLWYSGEEIPVQKPISISRAEKQSLRPRVCLASILEAGPTLPMADIYCGE